MVDIKKDDDLARPSRTLADPRPLVYPLHLADSSIKAKARALKVSPLEMITASWLVFQKSTF